eukprot:4739245-Amphidinium_carterae.6
MIFAETRSPRMTTKPRKDMAKLMTELQQPQTLVADKLVQSADIRQAEYLPNQDEFISLNMSDMSDLSRQQTAGAVGKHGMAGWTMGDKSIGDHRIAAPPQEKDQQTPGLMAGILSTQNIALGCGAHLSLHPLCLQTQSEKSTKSTSVTFKNKSGESSPTMRGHAGPTSQEAFPRERGDDSRHKPWRTASPQRSQTVLSTVRLPRACLPRTIVSTSDREYFQNSGFSSISYHQCSVLWRSTTFSLQSEDHVLIEDSPGRWGLAAVAARLTPHLGAGNMKHLTTAAVHVCNVLAKRPHAVISHINTLKEFLARNEVDVMYIDANQAAFARSASTPSTIDAQFTAEAGWLQSGSGGSLHCVATIGKSQCTGFLINQQLLRNRLQLWSHGTWITEPSDLQLRDTDEAYHSPSFLHFQSQGIPAGCRRRSEAAQAKRMEKHAERLNQRRGHSSENRWGGSSQQRGASSTNRWGGSSSTGDWSRWEDRRASAGGASSSQAPRPSSSGAQVTHSRGMEKVARSQHLECPVVLQCVITTCLLLAVFRCRADLQTPPQLPSPLHQGVEEHKSQLALLSTQTLCFQTAEAVPRFHRSQRLLLGFVVFWATFHGSSAQPQLPEAPYLPDDSPDALQQRLGASFYPLHDYLRSFGFAEPVPQHAAPDCTA